VAGRLKEDSGEVNALAKDLRSQLVRTEDRDTRVARLSAIGDVAGRLKAGGEEVNPLAKDLPSTMAALNACLDSCEVVFLRQLSELCGRLGDEVDQAAW
jgi:hypothetical protein